MAKKAQQEQLATPTINVGIQQKIAQAQREVNRFLIERRDEVWLVFAGLLAGKNVMLVGVPGIAKSRLAELLALVINGKAFNCQFNKFSQIEEVVGPLDVPSLIGQPGAAQSKYQRVIDHSRSQYIPWYNSADNIAEADVAILDELGKASTAIRNTLLRATNEGIIINGGKAYKLPLLFTLATANEWIGEADDAKEMAALFDRFALRKTVTHIASPAGLDRLLFDDGLDTPQFTVQLTPAEVRQARSEAMQIPWSARAKEVLKEVLGELRKEGIHVGDRRQRWSISVARAAAYLAGSPKVDPEHLEILCHVLWAEPIEQPQKATAVIMKKANPTAAKITQWLGEAQEIVANTNTKDLPQVIASVKKLDEIKEKLESIKDSERKEAAMEFVVEHGKTLRTAAMGGTL
jgi:MoxR-like ATPase